MAMKNALKIYTICKTIAIISFITTLGGCCACIGSTDSNAGEDYFQSSSGEGEFISRRSTGSHPYDFVAVISGFVFVVSSLGVGLYYGETEEGGKAMTEYYRRQMDKNR